MPNVDKTNARSDSTYKNLRFYRLKIVEIWRMQDGNYFCIATKPRDGGKWKDHWFESWEFSKIPQFLEDHEDDHDIYFCVHGYSEKIKHKDYAERSKVLWADLDGADPVDISLDFEPTIAFETSPGRFSALWIMDGYVTEELNQRLSYHLGADRTGWANTKVLRVVPGLRNYKYKEAPKVRYVWRDGPTHTVRRFDRLLPKLEATGGVKSVDRTPWEGTARALTQLAARFALNSKMRTKPTNADLSGIWWSLALRALEKKATIAEAIAIASNSKAFEIRFEGRHRHAQAEIDRLWDKLPREQARIRNERQAK